MSERVLVRDVIERWIIRSNLLNLLVDGVFAESAHIKKIVSKLGDSSQLPIIADNLQID